MSYLRLEVGDTRLQFVHGGRYLGSAQGAGQDGPTAGNEARPVEAAEEPAGKHVKVGPKVVERGLEHRGFEAGSVGRTLAGKEKLADGEGRGRSHANQLPPRPKHVEERAATRRGVRGWRVGQVGLLVPLATVRMLTPPDRPLDRKKTDRVAQRPCEGRIDFRPLFRAPAPAAIKDVSAARRREPTASAGNQDAEVKAGANPV